MANIGEYYRVRNGWQVVTDEVQAIYDEPPSYVHIRVSAPTIRALRKKVSLRVWEAMKRVARERAHKRRFERILARRQAAEKRAKDEFLKALTAGLVKVPWWDVDTSKLDVSKCEKVYEEVGFWEGGKNRQTDSLRVWRDKKGRFIVASSPFNPTFWVPPEYVRPNPNPPGGCK